MSYKIDCLSFNRNNDVYRVLSLLSILLLSVGCSNTIQVDANFPEPIIEALPVEAIAIFPPALKDFKYEEQEKNRDGWTIKAGDAHTALFRQIFTNMFSAFATGEEEPWPKAASPNTLYIVPSIKDFQYSSPKETRLNVYEVWFKYNIQVYDPQKKLIADWIMSSYGKTPSALLKSKDKAMEQAVIMSLRDLGASLSLGFKHVPELRDWLKSNTVTTAQLQKESRQ